MLSGLAEPKSWIEPDVAARQASGLQSPSLLKQIAAHLLDHIAVLGIGLHGLGLALHVHDTDAHALGRQGGGQGPHGGIAKAGDIVHHVDADRERLLDHLGPSAVERERQAQRLQGPEHRQHAVGLLSRRDGLGPRSGALSANIDDLCPIGLHPLGRLHSLIQANMKPAIREGVGGDIENAHDEGAMGRQLEAAQ